VELLDSIFWCLREVGVMRKLFTLFILGVIFLLATPVLAWNLFFIDQMENIAPPGEDEVMGFVLGEHKISQSRVVIIKTVGASSMFIYTTKSKALAQEAYGLPEFRGFGYVDMVTRIAENLSNAGTWNEIKYITGAHWWVPGESGHWMFGSVKEWIDGGRLEPVWFGRYRDILGSNLE